MSNPKEPKLTPQFEEWLEEQRLSGRRLSIEFVQNPDTTVSICLDRFTFGTFMRVAKDQNIDVRYMLSRALASTLGDMAFDKQRDGNTPAAYQRAMLFGSALDLLRSLKEMVATFENAPGETAQTAIEKARKAIALAEPAGDASSLLN
jgi:hypothetical protein